MYITDMFEQTNKEENEAVTVGRRRRSAYSSSHGTGVVLLRRDAKDVIDRYLDWRRRNGYGTLTRRWGK